MQVRVGDIVEITHVKRNKVKESSSAGNGPII